MSEDKYTLFGIPFQDKKLYKEAMQEIMQLTYPYGFYYADDIKEEMSELLILEHLHGSFNPSDKYLLDYIFNLIKVIRKKTNTTISDEFIIENIMKHFTQEIRDSFNADTHIQVDQFYKDIFPTDEASDRFDSYMDSVSRNYGKFSKEATVNPQLNMVIAEVSTGIKEKLKLKLKDYKPVGTDVRLSQEEKRRGVLNTIKILQEAIKDYLSVKKIEYQPFQNTIDKMTYTDGRNQKLGRLIQLMKNANVNYVLKDDEGNFFYPFIANIFFTHYETKSILEKYEDTLKTLKVIEYEANKLGTDIVDIINSEIKEALSFHKEIHKDQIWNYVSTVYAHRYNTAFNDMSKLIKFFIYDNPAGNNKSLRTPTHKIPKPLTELDKFTKNI